MSGWTIANIVKRNMKNERQNEIYETIDGSRKFHRSEADRIMESTDSCIPIMFGGYGRMEEAKEFLESLLNEGEKVIIVCANDTTDSGDSSEYIMKNEELVMVENRCKNGEERRMAEDIKTFYSEKDNLNIRVRYW